MQYITVEGIKFIVHADGRRIRADAVDLRVSFISELEYDLISSQLCPEDPNTEFEFILDYTKLIAIDKSKNTVVVLSQLTHLFNNSIIDKLWEALTKDTKHIIGQYDLKNTLIEIDKLHNTAKADMENQAADIKSYLKEKAKKEIQADSGKLPVIDSSDSEDGIFNGLEVLGNSGPDADSK